jgi:putative spermidine/putrescine transport system permease protein
VAARWGLRIAAIGVVSFLWLPLSVIFLYAFNADRLQAWPIRALTADWFAVTFNNPGFRDAFVTSVEAALGATAIAVVLGTLAALAVHRYRFFGREAISFGLVLPLALPGIVTGMALNATINTAGTGFGLYSIIIGHATFCIVVVYNNVVARLRRSARSIEEASADLGADPWQTFRYITLPLLGSALTAGALLAFALSFDEIIVTTFTAGTDETLPIWIFNNLSRSTQRPVVNVVAVIVILVSAIPVYVAQRLAGAEPPGAR